MIKDKTAIITVTQGDFEYIDEWIDYHHELGVELFLIGYNGDSGHLNDFQKRDYVRFIDFSYNDTNKFTFTGKDYSGWIPKEGSVYDSRRMQKIENILFDYVKYMYQDFRYLIIMDTDEFIYIKNSKYTNINDYLSDNFEEAHSSKSIWMNFYSDNNHVYKTSERCNDRFTTVSKIKTFNKQGCKKIVVDMHHRHVISGEVYPNSPHTVTKYIYGFDFPESDICLKHFWTKTLEEWIEKMNPAVDADYFTRFSGHIFTDFFKFNDMTEEKIKAIPELLKKYNIEYDIDCEIDRAFVEMYHRVNG